MEWQTYNRQAGRLGRPIMVWQKAGRKGAVRLSLGRLALETLNNPTHIIVQYAIHKLRLRAVQEDEEGLQLMAFGSNARYTALAATTLARLVGAIVRECWPWHIEIEDGIEWIVAEKPKGVENG